ncbi:MAG: tRNA-intron lyase [Candidatus Bathyarchaeota archaeon]|jgi:tRNA-intron endonuclease
MSKTIQTEFIENFLVVWDPKDGSELFKMGYYGKPMGIPKPKIAEFNVPLILDLMEGLYLIEKAIITVYEGPRKGKVSLKKLRQRARKLYEEFDLRYSVYKDLRDTGLIVTPGIKYGCDFAVYRHGPGIDHAPYMVSVRKSTDEVTATELVKAGRLATTVRKRFIIAVPNPENTKTQYLIFKWFKA